MLIYADENDLIGVLEASSDKVLPLVAKAIELSPALIPLAGPALSVPSTALYGAALASITTAGVAIAVIPDDSITNVALQTAIALPLGALVPGALAVGGYLLSKLK